MKVGFYYTKVDFVEVELEVSPEAESAVAYLVGCSYCFCSDGYTKVDCKTACCSSVYSPVLC